MDTFHIQGGGSLQGEITVGGAKNAALPIFASTLLTDEPCIIENVPDLSDIRFMAEILRSLGATVERLTTNSWRVEAKQISHIAPYELVRKMRASICLLGPLIGREKQADVSLPGGCVIGPRPIDLHLKGLSRLGCEYSIEGGYVRVDGKNAKGNYVFLGGRHGSTVLGTANILMAATLLPGITHIDSAACEPEIIDLCKMLVSMGAKIKGIGSHSLQIEGVKKLSGCTHSVISDRIEAGTYLIGSAMTQGDVTVHGANHRDLGALLDKMDSIGARVDILSESSVRVRAALEPYKPTDVITLPHPGYPTDLQAQMCALMCLTPGLSIITERVYPNRFMHVPELQRMGADIAIEGSSAIIKGVPRLSGAPVMASDLRASAALILAAVAAEGETVIRRIYHLDRGYEEFEKRMQSLGAQVMRIPEKELPQHLQEEPI
jgi:UDP-N-acetylglucosamine 1-carboxyvinyltransferase|tara:strand:+ start:10971 stop:12275 length:1305 start_codon:yes stop_codon:yes gene_type:complete